MNDQIPNFQDAFVRQTLQMLDKAKRPAALLDKEFFILWCSAAARNEIPTLVQRTGARDLLRTYDMDKVREEIAVRGFFQTRPHAETPFFEHSVLLYALPSAAAQYYLLTPTDKADSGSGLRPEGSARTLSSFETNYRFPLMTIFSAVSLLSRSLQNAAESKNDTEEQSQAAEQSEPPPLLYLQKIQCSAYSLLRSGKWILEYARLSSGASPLFLEPVECYGYLHHFFESAALLTEEQGIPMKWEIPKGTLMINCDLQKLLLILCNLLSNSCRFTRDGNCILIRVQHLSGMVTIRLSDHGTGMPPEVIARAVEPYFSYSSIGEPFAGNGLGLAIANQAVCALGGTMQLSSVPGEGTTVLVSLPDNLERTAAPYELHSDLGNAYEDRFSLLRLSLADSIEYPLQ